ncbi:MAG TPA: lysophospholipid acyltransferase family protein [Saprospiraceae bacterium]|nr:lysophospholipid acyltransferase family protein [Saprospiraceae bacterium]
MRFLFKITDFLVALLLRYVLKYRLKVIRNNLEGSFKYVSRKDREHDVWQNYLYLAKVLRQIIAVPSKRLLERRMHLVPNPSIDLWLSEGKSVIVTFGHTGNWEWTGSYLGVRYPDQVCALYKKIKSRRVNDHMYNRRLTHVNYLIETKQMGELLRLMKKKPILILMIADQNPGSAQGSIWTSFLGRNTAFVNGPESLALRYDLPVVYAYTTPEKDGGYTIECREIYNGKDAVAPGEITGRFARSLEENIQEFRSHWLWSHKRWKRKAQTVPQPL